LASLRGSISASACVHPNVMFGTDVTVSDFAVVGYPREALLLRGHDRLVAPTRIEDGAAIFPLAVIYDGARIGRGVIVEERCKIGFETSLGSESRVINGAIVHDQAVVGNRCVIGGIVCERATVGAESVVMGALLHSHSQPHVPWGIIEPSPRIGPRVVVAHGAAVIGDVDVANNVYIAANTIVTRDVPPCTVVVGVNRQIPSEHWTGDSPDREFWNWQGTGHFE
jgi:acetyltransferase-like isoleucine patch superfamily enzyme